MRFKITSVLWVGAVALALAITSSASARESGEKLTGTITAVNPTASTFTMETPTGALMYYTNKDTRLSSGGRPVNLENLAIGDRVTVRASKLMENAVVSRVDVVSSGQLTAENRRRDVLPKTASPLPLLGVLGSMLLGAAFAIRMGLRWFH